VRHCGYSSRLSESTSLYRNWTNKIAMMRKVGIFCVLLVVFAGFVLADATPESTGATLPTDPVVQAKLAETSRYLSAEAVQTLRDMQKQMTTDLQANQDADFQALDDRVKAYQQRELQMVLLGTVGAVMVTSAGVAIFLFRIARKHAYEAYLMAQSETDRLNGLMQGNMPQIQQNWVQPPNDTMVQSEYAPQETFQTIGMDQGQSYASNASKLSNWQVQPPYNGGWGWPQDGQQPPNGGQ